MVETSVLSFEGCLHACIDASIASTACLRGIARDLEQSGQDFLLLQLRPGRLDITRQELLRMQDILSDSDAPFLYADFRIAAADAYAKPTECRCIDYQLGSLRDDFDFGAMVLVRAQAVREAMASSLMTPVYAHAGWYQLRLALVLHPSMGGARQGRPSVGTWSRLPFRMNEFLYSFVPAEQDASTQFDYVNPRNREVQLEYEQVVTAYLKVIGAWIDPGSLRSAKDSELETSCDATREVTAEGADSGQATPEVSVVIPVYNRVRTVADAIKSALAQQTGFAFNVLVVDNHSDDGTSEAIDLMARRDARVIHIVPEETTLKIGGCWNKAISSPLCGRYVVQLDSDDTYSEPDTLQQMHDAFGQQDCVAVVGSYRLTDFDLRELPPGLISHSEWTPANGMNNALRVNGFGAPRAFLRDLVRLHPMPNTSYGEDYAAMLRISRDYRIGRIYHALYNCRRWAGNSDAALSREQAGANDFYKDRIRTIELYARLRHSL